MIGYLADHFRTQVAHWEKNVGNCWFRQTTLKSETFCLGRPPSRVRPYRQTTPSTDHLLDRSSRYYCGQSSHMCWETMHDGWAVSVSMCLLHVLISMWLHWLLAAGYISAHCLSGFYRNWFMLSGYVDLATWRTSRQDKCTCYAGGAYCLVVVTALHAVGWLHKCY